MKTKFLVVLFILLAALSNAQVITWTPYFATRNDTITIIYDATQGQSGLAGVFPVYAHTGVITNLSANGKDWKYVKTNWGVNTPETMMQFIGNNKWQIKFKIQDYYNVPLTETILKLAFVFRNSAGTLTGKDSDGSDLYVPLSVSGNSVKVTSPSSQHLFNLNDSVTISALAANATNLKVYANNELVAESNGSAITVKKLANSYDKIRVRAIATIAGGATISDSSYYLVRQPITVAEVPAGLKKGINYTSNTSATLVLQAPLKSFVYVIGDFNNWELDPVQYMKRTADSSTFWVTINNLTPLQEYAFQYSVDNSINVADPFADKILDPWNDSYIDSARYPGLKPYPSDKASNVVSVLQAGQVPFSWQVPTFTRPDKSKLIIYECLIRDFTAKQTYKSVMDTLDYLVRLGVNALELMPVMEFEGNLSWGYNPDFHFAPDKFYGTKDDLKRLIDKCHQKGIAVIFDVVLNHAMGLSPFARMWWDNANSRPAANSPYFNAVAMHPYNVGNDFNHESVYTRAFVDQFLQYWTTEYKADGFRFDLSKGFTQTNSGSNVSYWGQKDQSRINNLNRMATQIRAIDPNIYLILEHFANDDEEQILASNGFMLWSNSNSSYNEATMGYHDSNKSDFGRVSYKNHGFASPAAVGYMESHDEERLMYKNLQYGNSNGTYSIKSLPTALDRMKLASAFFYTVPGPKMLWQFGELGFDLSINYPCGTETCRLDQKPPKWDYLAIPQRVNLFKTISALAKLKKNYDAFSSTNYTLVSTGELKRLTINGSDMNVNIVGNFSVADQQMNPSFPNTGKWYDYFTGDSITVTDVSASISLKRGEFKIYTTTKLPVPEAGIGVGIEKDDTKFDTPTEYKLLQNFPNPFNPTTKISFALPAPGMVKLAIYNTLGEQVAELVNQELTTGNYTYSFDASHLASGVYLYRLEAGSLIQTKKMILLK